MGMSRAIPRPRFRLTAASSERLDVTCLHRLMVHPVQRPKKNKNVEEFKRRGAAVCLGDAGRTGRDRKRDHHSKGADKNPPSMRDASSATMNAPQWMLTSLDPAIVHTTDFDSTSQKRQSGLGKFGGKGGFLSSQVIGCDVAHSGAANK